MEENNLGYDPSEFEDDDLPQPDAGKSIRGYRIVIVILSVILVALSILYFSMHRQQMLDNQLLQSDRDSIQNDLGRLMDDYDNLRISNDTISANLDFERQRADSLMTRLKKERSWNLAKIKQYEKEVGTLRTIMRGYLHQIDSLNSLNKQLIRENVSYRKEISSANLRAEVAEEKAAELNNKVRVGSVVRARDIRLTALGQRGGHARRTHDLRAHHLARRLRADHRGDAHLRVRGRTAELFGLAQRRLPEPGPRRGYLLQQFGLRCGNLPRAALLRRLSDRLVRDRDAIAAGRARREKDRGRGRHAVLRPRPFEPAGSGVPAPNTMLV